MSGCNLSHVSRSWSLYEHRNHAGCRRAPATLREQAYGSFTRHLLARDLRPGQFVTQRELVDLTGFTLGAIRELIPRLDQRRDMRHLPPLRDHARQIAR